MNWIKKKLFNSKLGNNIKEIFLKKFPSKEEQNESKYISCHSTPMLKEDLEKNLWTCEKCGKNHRISPRYRFDNIIFGKSQWTEIPAPVPKDDPLNFSDAKGSYSKRLKEARANTKQDTAVLSAVGKINGINVVSSAINFSYLGGSVGSGEGENILTAVQYAIDHRCPYLLFPASGGMRMMEGLISLSQMTRMTIAINELKKNKLLFLVCFVDPTSGGTTASIASLSDIAISEPGATIAFSGRRVIEGILKGSETLPPNFQTAEWVKEKSGQIDIIVERKNLTKTIGTLLSILLKKDSNVSSSSDENKTTESNTTLTKAS